MFLGALLLPLIAWRLGASPVALGLGHVAVSAVLTVLVAAGSWLLKVSVKDAQRPPVAAQSAVRPARTPSSPYSSGF